MTSESILNAACKVTIASRKLNQRTFRVTHMWVLRGYSLVLQCQCALRHQTPIPSLAIQSKIIGICAVKKKDRKIRFRNEINAQGFINALMLFLLICFRIINWCFICCSSMRVERNEELQTYQEYVVWGLPKRLY
jgi:hypothetical protein